MCYYKYIDSVACCNIGKDAYSLDIKENRSKLRKARKEKDLSQSEVAESVGISPSFYTQIENGDRNPRLEIAKKISKFLNINLEKWC